jgi:hypothetical protein
MNTPDQDTVLRAVEDARRVLGEYLAPGRRDATPTVERLLTILDRNDLVHALDRIKMRRVARLVDLSSKPSQPPRKKAARTLPNLPSRPVA